MVPIPRRDPGSPSPVPGRSEGASLSAGPKVVVVVLYQKEGGQCEVLGDWS